MAEVILSEDAERDLAAIFDYTVEHWSVAQAVKYVGQFDGQFAVLAEVPFFGTRRPDIADDIRSLSCGRHVVYFRSSDEQVSIVRVLHASMVPGHHL